MCGTEKLEGKEDVPDFVSEYTELYSRLFEDNESGKEDENERAYKKRLKAWVALETAKYVMDECINTKCQVSEELIKRVMQNFDHKDSNMGQVIISLDNFIREYHEINEGDMDLTKVQNKLKQIEIILSPDSERQNNFYIVSQEYGDKQLKQIRIYLCCPTYTE
ncbi:hypothetical protein RFI_00570, partial [Reticulomyxa filosa]